MDVRKLIPKDKGDEETAEQLMQYSYEQVKPIVPQLLKWLQDSNWPVSRPVAKYLSSILPYITNEVVDVLRSDDCLWKYWCIDMLLLGRKDIDARIINELRHIATSTDRHDVENEVDALAREVLADIT